MCTYIVLLSSLYQSWFFKCTSMLLQCIHSTWRFIQLCVLCPLVLVIEGLSWQRKWVWDRGVPGFMWNWNARNMMHTECLTDSLTRAMRQNTYSWINLQAGWTHCKSTQAHFENHDYKIGYTQKPRILWQDENYTNMHTRHQYQEWQNQNWGQASEVKSMEFRKKYMEITRTPLNKIGKVYSLEHTNLPKVSLTPNHVRHCTNNAILRSFLY